MIRNSLQKYLVVAQEQPTGSIAGTVTDPQGAVVAGANVTLTDAATDNQSMRAGAYTITVKASDFKKALATQLQIDVSKTSNIDVNFEVGCMKETVTVVAGGRSNQTAIRAAAT